MFEQVLLALLKEVVVPELAGFIRDRFTATGTWPTKEELEAKADEVWQANKNRGEEFLNRPKDPPFEKQSFDDNGL